MKKIYSKIFPDEILHIVGNLKDIKFGRCNVSPEKEILQLANYRLNAGKKVDAHKHCPQERKTVGTQESWIVFRGSIESTYHDLDDSFISKEVLHAGDFSITFRGGHSLKSMEDNTIVFEHKNGPYYGIEKDKKQIGVK